MNNVLFDYASEIYHLLRLCGQSNVCAFLNRHYYEAIYCSKTIDVEETNSEAFEDYCEKIKREEYLYPLAYLLAIDNYIDEHKKFLINYVMNNREKDLTSDSSKALLFPTFGSVDHQYIANDMFQALFKNMYFVDKQLDLHNKRLSMHNYYVDWLYTTNDIRIIFIPYPEEGRKIIVKNKVLHFDKTTYLKFISVYKKRIEMIAELHDSNYVPTIVFGPELGGSEEVDKLFIRAHKNNRDIIAMISPSCYVSENEKTYNRSFITISENRRIREDYLYKHRGMEDANHNYEDISSDKGINFVVINIEQIGKVAIVICKDFLTDDYVDIIKNSLFDLVIIQSYSGNIKEFENRFEEVCRYNITTILGNNCSAIKDGDTNNVVVTCGKREKYNQGRTVGCIRKGDGGIECRKNCQNVKRCFYSITLTLTQSSEKDISPVNYFEIKIKEEK